MCAGCLSTQSADYDSNQFGVGNTKNGAYGDKGLTIQASAKFDGDNGQSKKFEGLAPTELDSAATVQYTGRQ